MSKKSTTKKTTKKTGKKTTKKPTKAELRRRYEANRGSRLKRPVRSVQLRLPSDLIEWLDAQAADLQMNRTQFLRMLLDSCRDVSEVVEQRGGLFDKIQHRMEEAMVEAFKNLPRAELHRILGSPKL